MDRMGHAQITTTQKYLHTLPDADHKASTPSPALDSDNHRHPSETPLSPTDAKCSSQRQGTLPCKRTSGLHLCLSAVDLVHVGSAAPGWWAGLSADLSGVPVLVP